MSILSALVPCQRGHTDSYGYFSSIQFAQTGEILLLKQTDLQIQKLQLHNDVRETEIYINSFVCSVESCGSNRALNLVDSAILKINMYCLRQLESYHLYFSQVSYLPCLDTISAEDFFDTPGDL
jgi:hypothetical protein